MNEKTKKIIFSAASLVLSFIIPIEIANIALLLLSSVTLLEETIKEAIPLIQKKEWSLPPILLVVLSILLVYIREYRLLLVFLLFYHIKDYIYLLLVEKNRKEILDTLHFEHQQISLRTVSGMVKAKWKDLKPGDIIYLNAGEVCYIEGILLSESLLYETPYTHQKNHITEGEMVPSGALICETAAIKLLASYQESKLYEHISKLKKTMEAQTVIFGKELEGKYNRLIWMAGFLTVLANIFIFPKSTNDIILMIASFLALLSLNSIPTLLEANYFMSLVKLLKKDIYCKCENVLEKLSKIKTVVFSKTGLFTSETLTLTKVIPVYQSKEEVIRYAALAEYGSLHPIAKAIHAMYHEKILPEQVYFTEDIKGKGRHAIIEGKDIYIGNHLLFEALNINVPKIDFLGSSILLAIDGAYAATLVFSYTVKDNTYLTSSLLREEGIEKVSLISSGEVEQIKKIGAYLSMNESFASLTQEEKIEVLKMYQKNAPVMLVDYGFLDQELTHYIELGVCCCPKSNDNPASLLLLDNNLESVVYLKKEANLFEKIGKIIFASYFSIKTLLFILIGFRLIAVDGIAFFLLLYDFSFTLMLMRRMRT